MPYANYSDKLAANRRYAMTPKGRAAKARSHARYVEKRRQMARRADMTLNPAPLAQAVSTWRT